MIIRKFIPYIWRLDTAAFILYIWRKDTAVCLVVLPCGLLTKLDLQYRNWRGVLFSWIELSGVMVKNCGFTDITINQSIKLQSSAPQN